MRKARGFLAAAAVLFGLNRAPDDPPCFTRRDRGEALSPRRQEAGAVPAAHARPPAWIPLDVKWRLPPAEVWTERPLRQESLPSGRLCTAPMIQTSLDGPGLRQLAVPVSLRPPLEGARSFHLSTLYVQRHTRWAERAHRFSGIRHRRSRRLPVSAAKRANSLHLPRQACGHPLAAAPRRPMLLRLKRPPANGGQHNSAGALIRVPHCLESLARHVRAVRLRPAKQEP